MQPQTYFWTKNKSISLMESFACVRLKMCIWIYDMKTNRIKTAMLQHRFENIRCLAIVSLEPKKVSTKNSESRFLSLYLEALPLARTFKQFSTFAVAHVDCSEIKRAVEKVFLKVQISIKEDFIRQILVTRIKGLLTNLFCRPEQKRAEWTAQNTGKNSEQKGEQKINGIFCYLNLIGRSYFFKHQINVF